MWVSTTTSACNQPEAMPWLGFAPLRVYRAVRGDFPQ
jgi:hypothetical protein